MILHFCNVSGKVQRIREFTASKLDVFLGNANCIV